MPCLTGYCLCSNTIFHLLVPPRGHFFVIIRSHFCDYSVTHSLFCHYAVTLFDMPSCFRPHTLTYEAAAALNSCHSTSASAVCLLCISEFSKQGRYAVRKGLSYIIVRQGLPFHSVGPSGTSRLCRPWRFFKAQVADLHLVISGQFCTLMIRTSNTERNMSAETMQKSRSGYNISKFYKTAFFLISFEQDADKSTFMQKNCLQLMDSYPRKTKTHFFQLI